MSIHKPADTGENNGGRSISCSPVDFEGNIIGTDSGVVGTVNDRVDEVFSDILWCTRDTFVVDLEKFGGVLSRRVMPFITPELSENLVDFDRVTSDSVVNVFDGSNSFLGSRERATNSGKLVGGGFGSRVIGISSKLSVDKIQQGSTITVRREWIVE